MAELAEWSVLRAIGRQSDHSTSLAAFCFRVIPQAKALAATPVPLWSCDERPLSCASGRRVPRKNLSDRPAPRDRPADQAYALGRRNPYSHSIVPGGFDVMSSVTRFTCAISLIMREATRSSRS